MAISNSARASARVQNAIPSLRQKTIAATALCLWLSFPLAAFAQSSTTCGLAVNQLQQYVQQVNQVTTYQYYQVIPGFCGPNAFCLQGYYQQLNAWYAQQSGLVNSWYAEIARTCTTQRTARRVPRRSGRDEAPELDEDQIDDLEVDDEDKTVAIRIPSTPQGFRAR